jgi:hypothetical protein
MDLPGMVGIIGKPEPDNELEDFCKKKTRDGATVYFMRYGVAFCGLPHSPPIVMSLMGSCRYRAEQPYAFDMKGLRYHICFKYTPMIGNV